MKNSSSKKKLFSNVKIWVLVIILALIFLIWRFIDLDLNKEKNDSGDNNILSGEVQDEVKEEQLKKEYNVKSGINGRIEQDSNDEEKIEYIEYEGTKSVGKVEFSNIQIAKIANNKCIFMADVKNTSKDFLKAEKVSISVIDQNGKVKETFGGILTELAGLEPNKFKTQVLSDISYASDFEIEVVNE